MATKIYDQLLEDSKDVYYWESKQVPKDLPDKETIKQ